ncbi:alpha/beta fold hydrolase [Caulobacter segnis]
MASGLWSCWRRRAMRSSSSRTRRSPWKGTPPPRGRPSPGAKHPVILVGHSYGGAVITEAGADPKVKSPAHLAAFAPDAGEGRCCGWPARRSLARPRRRSCLRQGRFHSDRSGQVRLGVRRRRGSQDHPHFMAASQVPWGLGAVRLPRSPRRPGKAKPSYYLLATRDLMIPPAAQRAMAVRAKATLVENAQWPRRDALQARPCGRLHRDGGRRRHPASRPGAWTISPRPVRRASPPRRPSKTQGENPCLACSRPRPWPPSLCPPGRDLSRQPRMPWPRRPPKPPPRAPRPAGDPLQDRHGRWREGGLSQAGPADGPVILLLHGFPTSSHMFRNLIPLLADKYRVIAPDYPGYARATCARPHPVLRILPLLTRPT